MWTTTAQKNRIFGSLFTSLYGSLGFCFFALNFVNRKMIKCFFLKLNKYWESFLLLRPRSLENSKKGLFTFWLQRKLCAGAELDAFQRAVIVFTIVLCSQCCRYCPCCVRLILVERSSTENVPVLIISRFLVSVSELMVWVLNNIGSHM